MRAWPYPTEAPLPTSTSGNHPTLYIACNAKTHLINPFPESTSLSLTALPPLHMHDLVCIQTLLIPGCHLNKRIAGVVGIFSIILTQYVDDMMI